VSAASSCALLPGPGPTRNELFAGSVQNQGDAFIVEVNARVTSVTSSAPVLGFPASLINAGASDTEVIRPGDLLALTIYENVSDGLLAGEGGNAATIESVQVDSAGFIFIPYAGRIRAAGNTTEQLREMITRNLDEQTPDPQVIVRREAGDGATVTVSGAVAAQGIYPIQRPTATLSGMLAAAGGVAVEPEIAQVTVLRGGHRARSGTRTSSAPVTPISRCAPATASSWRRTAAPSPRLAPPDSKASWSSRRQNISALEAIASVGGLNPRLADPSGVFVLRNEPEQMANAVLGRHDLVGTQRFVYVLDLTAPTGMFEARDFAIRDGDTVYVTAAPISQWNNAISALTGSLTSTVGLANTIDGLGE
jgi:polysaccharide export outer membrane protein